MTQSMTPRPSRLRSAGAVLLLVSVVALTGCARAAQSIAPEGASLGSRVAIYSSLQQLVADSAIIVSGAVTQQTAGPSAGGGEASPGTISTFTVAESFAPAGVSSSLAGGVTSARPPTGTVVTIRQFGTPGSISTGGPLLEPNAQYLLFLNPTMLPGDAAEDYFIVGSEAGIYRADGERFVRVASGGDRLPQTIDPATDLK
jgi:hypothetical protein